jgi:hypothetical protein
MKQEAKALRAIAILCLEPMSRRYWDTRQRGATTVHQAEGMTCSSELLLAQAEPGFLHVLDERSSRRPPQDSGSPR